MTLFAIHELCFRLRNEAAFEERFRDDPEGHVEHMDLSAEERAALLAGDVRALHQLGVHGYLLQTLARAEVFGLTRANYLPRIRGEEPVRRPRP